MKFLKFDKVPKKYKMPFLFDIMIDNYTTIHFTSFFRRVASSSYLNSNFKYGGYQDDDDIFFLMIEKSLNNGKGYYAIGDHVKMNTN
jgi:hypothetical protein